MLSQPNRRAMTLLPRINGWLKGHFLGMLLGAVGVGALFPRVGLFIKDLEFLRVPGTHWSYDFSNLALGLMMLSASVQCELKDFRQLVARPKAAAVSLFVIYLVVPALVAGAGAIANAVLPGGLGPQVQIGLLLSALMPVAMTSAVWVRNNAGTLPLLVSLITLTNALALATVPLYLGLLVSGSGATSSIPVETIVQQLVLSASVPLALGLLLRRALPGLVRRSSELFPLFGNLALLAIVVANVAVAIPHVLAERRVFVLMALLAVGLNVLCYAVGLALARVFGLAREDAISLLFGSGMRSNSTGLVLGVKAFAGMPLVAVPAAIYMISQHVIAAYLTRLLERRGSRLLGPAIASEPESLTRYLDRALSPAEPHLKGVALVVVQASGPEETVRVQMRTLMRQARKQLRLGDFVCWLSPDRFGVVLVDTQPIGCELVISRLARLAAQTTPGLSVRCGAAHSDQGRDAVEGLIAPKLSPRLPLQGVA